MSIYIYLSRCASNRSRVELVLFFLGDEDLALLVLLLGSFMVGFLVFQLLSTCMYVVCSDWILSFTVLSTLFNLCATCVNNLLIPSIRGWNAPEVYFPDFLREAGKTAKLAFFIFSVVFSLIDSRNCNNFSFSFSISARMVSGCSSVVSKGVLSST